VDLADHDVTHALRSPTSLELAVQRGFLGPLRTANTHDNFKCKDIFMRRGLSRRNLVTGTAWAAPLVLSTAVIPAYASSSADDGPCLDPDKSYDIFAKDVRTAAQSRAAGEKGYEEIVVPDYASYMRFYLRGGSGGSRVPPPETHNRATGTPGVEHVNRGNTNGAENPKIEKWLKYQEQITGWKRNNKGEMPEYTLYDSKGKPVRIDGRTWRGHPPQEVYLDAKRGYQRAYYDPTNTKGMQQQLIDEAKRQRRVLPPGAKLEWHISSREGADAISRILEDARIYNVDVIYTPER